MGEPFLLLIEENLDDVYLMMREIRRLDPSIRVDVMSDSAEALEHLKASSELPSMVMLGLKFIRLSGLELLKELRDDSRTRALPVVLLTAGLEERERIRWAVEGADRVSCVSKPVRGGVLESVLERFGIRLESALAV